jgi:hypothetical protein
VFIAAGYLGGGSLKGGVFEGKGWGNLKGV